MRMRMHDVVAEKAVSEGDAPALTFGNTTMTYAQLWHESVRFAAGLRSMGLARADRVAIYLDKRIETVSAIFGVSAADGVFVPVNPLFKARQLGHILIDSEARVLVTTAERYQLVRDELDECKSLEYVVLIGGVDETSYAGASYNVVGWEAIHLDTPISVSSPVIDIDMAAIFYTSGSTGKAKGVVLSHRNLLVGAESVAAYLENTSNDVILAALPLSFDAGFSQLTTGFLVGAHVVLMNYVLATDVVRMCVKHAITGLTGVPPLWIQLTDHHWPDEARRNLRYFANTGGRMPKATLKRLRATFPQAKPYLMYGLTEAFRSTYLDPAEVDRRPDSIGKAIPNAEILVVRPDGSVCDPGEEGELVHRGALVSLGYWNDPERTAERFRPAPGRPEAICVNEMAVWSGDAVVRDAEGFLYFVGRKDEMIKTSGYRVSPTEIEEAVYDTGLVGDAVALGVADARIGQHIVLVASPKDVGVLDPEALLGELRKALPAYMMPREVHVRLDIPRSPNGKFDRNLLRQELTQG
jgi:acyl-CoA ligase (AMP-forming) (exosortase A-associated)